MGRESKVPRDREQIIIILLVILTVRYIFEQPVVALCIYKLISVCVCVEQVAALQTNTS